MVGPDDRIDFAKVALAASALIESYGADAAEKATLLAAESASPEFAEAVRLEVVRRLSLSSDRLT